MHLKALGSQPYPADRYRHGILLRISGRNQSALKSRASVTLFTAAVLYQETTNTYLICSNTKDKGKDTVHTFINRL